ncbi:MAG: metallophosphoesterase [Acutalibacteraceae bacterium]|jgi:predicted phosphohydrolase
MALYAIGDTHLSLGVDKPMDDFGGWDHYVERLEQNWRALVGPGDTVVIAGDVSWAMNLEQAAADFAFLDRLPGQKLLIKGNHDYWWTTRKKMDAFFAERGFSTLRIVHNDAVAVDGRVSVCGTRGWFFDAEEDADRLILDREIGRLHASAAAARQTGLPPVAFLHYPPVFGEYVCEDMIAALKEEGITRCYYGHVHGPGIRKAFNGVWEGIALRLISADALGFTPLFIP